MRRIHKRKSHGILIRRCFILMCYWQRLSSLIPRSFKIYLSCAPQGLSRPSGSSQIRRNWCLNALKARIDVHLQSKLLSRLSQRFSSLTSFKLRGLTQLEIWGYGSHSSCVGNGATPVMFYVDVDLGILPTFKASALLAHPWRNCCQFARPLRTSTSDLYTKGRLFS